MYMTDHNWHPSGTKAPCFVGKECIHHKETNGKCREDCSDFNLYKALGTTRLETIAAENIKEPIRRVRRYS